jgi:hypothetical protein
VSRSRCDLLFLVAVLVLTLALAVFVVQSFETTLTGPGDQAIWSYLGFYFHEHVSWTPFPSLDFRNDVTFYPYGVSHVFQSWSVEREMWQAFFFHIFGHGPWLQIYFVLSTAGTAVLAYFLLGRDHPRLLAAVLSLALAFANFYPLAKCFGHFSVTCWHWTTLSILTDSVLVRRLSLGKPWSAPLLLLRAALLVLALGQDLGYVAGPALTSFCVTVAWLLVLSLVRARSLWPWSRESCRRFASSLRASARSRRWTCLLLIVVLSVAAFLYVPVVLQIRSEVEIFDMEGLPRGVFWANPARLLLPIFPVLNPTYFRRELTQFFADQPEGSYAASPGWFFLFIGLTGLVVGRRRMAIAVPFLALFALYLSFHPDHFPLLRVLPWHHFSRVTGRFTAMYPTILVVCSLLVTGSFLASLRGRRFVLIALLLLGLEMLSAYAETLIKPKDPYVPDREFLALMGEIEKSPGEALLEWPFCIAGGNGVATDVLGLYYTRLGSVFTYRQFHGKKVLGEYFGRLHPDQVRPFIEAGWPALFLPDDADPRRATRQRRDFTPGEWAFLEDFYRDHDFAGILLYTDLLPESTVEEFHRRFGSVVAEARAPGPGRMEFLRR